MSHQHPDPTPPCTTSSKNPRTTEPHQHPVAEVLTDIGLSPVQVSALDSESLGQLLEELKNRLKDLPGLPVKSFGVHLLVTACVRTLLSAELLPSRPVLASVEKSAKNSVTVTPTMPGKHRKVPNSLDVPLEKAKVAKHLARQKMETYPVGTNWKDIKNSDAVKRLKTECLVGSQLHNFSALMDSVLSVTMRDKLQNMKRPQMLAAGPLALGDVGDCA
eukprot:gene22618-29761_t